jgi:regulator of RNase E activity RraA
MNRWRKAVAAAAALQDTFHVVEFGGPVEVGNLVIQPGDLIHGHRHGIITIPKELAPRLPATARAIREKKQQLMALSKKPGTTTDELSRGLKDLLDFHPDSLRDGAKPWKR